MEKYWIIKDKGKVFDRALYTSKDEAILEIYQNPEAFSENKNNIRFPEEFDIVEIEI